MPQRSDPDGSRANGPGDECDSVEELARQPLAARFNEFIRHHRANAGPGEDTLRLYRARHPGVWRVDPTEEETFDR